VAEDWGGPDDAFGDPDDPQAAAREERRREREARRLARQEKDVAKEASDAAAPPPPPPPAPDPPVPPRTPEDEFWDEDPEPYEDEEAGEEAPSRRFGSPPPRGPRSGSGILAALRRHPLRVVAAVAAVAVAWFLVALFQPFHGDGSGRVVVTIPKGSSVSEVGDLLGEKGVVSSSILFQVRVTLAGKRSSLYPGRFVLAHDMS
jgi:UPF0755 protein